MNNHWLENHLWFRRGVLAFRFHSKVVAKWIGSRCTAHEQTGNAEEDGRCNTQVGTLSCFTLQFGVFKT